MHFLIHFFLFFLIFIPLYLFLIAPRMGKKPDRTPFCNIHYAHRGLFDNTSNAPENSLAAFQKAVDAGYGIELDVQLTKDNKPIIFHDATLKRMCGIKGNVWDYTLEELRQFRLLSSNEKIPTLEEFLKIVDGKVPFILEFKLDVAQTTVCELTNETLKNYKGTYCIECFHPYALMWYKKHRPDILRGQLSEEFFRNRKYACNPLILPLSFLLFNFLGRPDFIAFNYKHADNLSRRICRAMGALSIAYTIQSLDAYVQSKNKFDLFIFDSCRL